MRLAVFAFTKNGCLLARKIEAHFGFTETRKVTMEKFGFSDFEAYHPPLDACMGPYFQWADMLVFVGSTGMAVRAIAPWVQHKTKDPAVLTVDEQGKFVISLLSGHIGGANAGAKALAEALGAVPVITTATDVNGKFSPDGWASEHGAVVSDLALCKQVSAAILERDVPICSDFPLTGTLPGGLVLQNQGDLGIYIGWQDRKPYQHTLRLIPRVIRLGIGCRRGTPREAISEAVRTVLEEYGIPLCAVAEAASIDLKRDEQGLLDWCREQGVKAVFYTAQELLAVPGEFPASDFVKSVTGVDNVCQRAAMLGTNRLLFGKTALHGVTVAAAEQYWEAAL